jgi:ABC-type lipoprotein release transport system permease subunit
VAVGLAAGAVVALAAGARRTESAYDRFLVRSLPSDVLIQASSGFVGPGVDQEAVAQLPQVRRVARGVVLFMGGTAPSGRRLTLGDFIGVASSDGRFGRSVDRWTLLEGRRPDDRRADEVVIGFDTARQLDAHAGDIVDLVFPTKAEFLTATVDYAEQLGDLASGRGERSPFDVDRALPSSLRLRAKIVGIAATPGEIPPDAKPFSGSVRLTPAFYDQHATELASNGLLAVQLRPGTSLAAFKTAVEGLSGGDDAQFFQSEPTQTAAVNRSFQLQATALRIFAAFVLLVALLVLGQALARLTVSESEDFPTLRALGMTRLELFAVGIARAFTIAVPAAGVCALIAVGLSRFWPAGLAGTIEPAPGFAVDPSAIGIGCVLVLLVVAFLAAWPAWQAAGGAADRRRAPGKTSRVARVLSNGSRAFAVRVGIRLALEPGRGRRAVPVRTAMAVGAVAIAATAMAVTFSSSLTSLRDTPRLYGWNWDAQIGAPGFPDVSGPLVAGLEANPAVDDIAAGTVANVSVNGVRVDALALDAVRGRVDPVLLEGRAPRADDEIALGTATMRDLRVETGDDVKVGVGAASATLRVVGRAVFPNLGDAAQLGRGAAMSLTALEALDTSAPKNIVLIRFTPEGSPAALRSRLRRAISPYPVFGPQRPDDLVSLGNLDGLAVALGLMLAALAAATLAHTLVSSIRRRAADLAVLKALGVTRGQVGAIIGWQAAALLAIALAIGLPMGIAAARVAWRVLAAQLGVPGEPTLNLVALALIIPVVLLLGVIAASGPANAAARTSPVRVLRDE